MSQSPDNKNDKNIIGKLDSKIASATDALGNGIDKFAGSFEKTIDKFGEKIDSIDEDKLEESLTKFFTNLWKWIVAFFTITIPKVIRAIISFFTITIPKIKNRLEKIFGSGSWQFVAGFLFLIIALIVCLLMANLFRT